jgi:hypothetical protein
MEQLIVLLIAGVFVLIKWFLERAESTDDGSDQGPPRQPMADRQEREDEQTRRLMEALGLPEEAMPPRKVTLEIPEPEIEPAPPRPPIEARRLAKTTGPTIRKRNWVERPRSVRRQIAPPQPLSPHEVASVEIPEAQAMSQVAPLMELQSIAEMGGAEETERRLEEANRQLQQSTAKPGGVPKQGWAGASMRDQLRDPEAIRRLIVMREILGAPKSLQT